jgi:hypothetical protein
VADNTPQNGTSNIATDDLATINGGAVGTAVQVQRVKNGYGADGDLRDVDITHGMPVQSQQVTAAVTVADFTASTAAVTVLASNAVRKGAVFFNGTDVDVLLKFGVTPTVTSYTLRVSSGGYYELPGQNVIYVGALTGLPVTTGTLTPAAATTGTFSATELS